MYPATENQEPNLAYLDSPDIQTELLAVQNRYSEINRTQTQSLLNRLGASVAADVSGQVTRSGWIGAPTWINMIAGKNSEFMESLKATPTYVPPGDEKFAKDAAHLLNQYDSESDNNLLFGTAYDNSSSTLAENFKASFYQIFQPDAAAKNNPMAHFASAGRQIMNTVMELQGYGEGTKNADKYRATGKSTKLYDINGLDTAQLLSTRKSEIASAQSAYDNARPDQKSQALENLNREKSIPIAITMPLVTAGFMLGFLLPLLPFFRFMLGVLGWLMLVFEAIMAIPLLALAHLKTDGEGFMGSMAQQGYMMILGLVLRPIMMVIGLIFGLIAFNTIIQVTNMLFVPAVIGSLGSINAGETRMSMMSFIMNILLYSSFISVLANSAFKMIDMAPNSVMSWIGARMDSKVDDASTIQGNTMGSLNAVGMYAGGRGMGRGAQVVGSGGVPAKDMSIAGRLRTEQTQGAQQQQHADDQALGKQGIAGSASGYGIGRPDVPGQKPEGGIAGMQSKIDKAFGSTNETQSTPASGLHLRGSGLDNHSQSGNKPDLLNPSGGA